jgi:hypothetical protein
VPRAANIEAYFDSDDPGADHDHRARHPVEMEHAVGVDHVAVVELDRRRAHWLGAGGDHDLLAADGALVGVLAARDPDGVRVDEAAGALQQVDVVAQQLCPDHLDLASDHMLGAGHQIGDRDVGLHPVALAVDVPQRQSAEIDDGFAQRLRRDRPGVDADTAEHRAALDDCHPLAEFRSGDRGLLPARSGSEHHEVVVVHRFSLGSTAASLASPASSHWGKHHRLAAYAYSAVACPGWG